MAYFMNPETYYNYAYGKSIDTDNYPKSQKYQCFDTFADFCYKNNLKVDLLCSITGYAGDLYKLRYEKGYDRYFEFFFPRHAERGDWIFWSGHVAMVWEVNTEKDKVLCLGQNQGGAPYVNLKWYTLSTALGCMRFKEWIKPMNGWNKENKNWFYYRDGKKLTGLQTLAWSKGTDTFLFSSDGVMLTGWQLYNGKWYYFSLSTGAALKGLQKLTWKGKEDFYCFDTKSCAMLTGTFDMELTFDGSGKLTGGVKA